MKLGYALLMLVASAALIGGGGKMLGKSEPIYLEDTEERYLRIDKGSAGSVTARPAKVPHREDLKLARYINGDVRFLFTTLYGWENPRIIVESKDRKGYAVTYDHYDEGAMAVVARELGLVMGKEEREIYALVMTRTDGPMKMNKAEKPEKPFEPLSGREGWPIEAMSMDEVARFLETRYRRPVVNHTGLEGYYSFVFSKDSAKMWPQTVEEVKKLDDTGLQIQWEKVAVEALVIKDPPQEDEGAGE